MLWPRTAVEFGFGTNLSYRLVHGFVLVNENRNPYGFPFASPAGQFDQGGSLVSRPSETHTLQVRFRNLLLIVHRVECS